MLRAPRRCPAARRAKATPRDVSRRTSPRTPEIPPPESLPPSSSHEKNAHTQDCRPAVSTRSSDVDRSPHARRTPHARARVHRVCALRERIHERATRNRETPACRQSQTAAPSVFYFLQYSFRYSLAGVTRFLLILSCAPNRQKDMIFLEISPRRASV